MASVNKWCRTTSEGILDVWRGASVISIGVVAFLTFSIIGFDSMRATLCANAILAIFVLWREKSHWLLAVAGLFVFPLFHTLEQKLWFTIWPDFTCDWNQDLLWRQKICGGRGPLGEILFHLSFVAFCPLGVAYVRRLTIVGRC